jgi:hypothetical protein
VPYAEPFETGPGTDFPLPLDSLNTFCGWIWNVHQWSLSITNLRNEFQTFTSHSATIANHSGVDGTAPQDRRDIIRDHGFALTHPFTATDQEGDDYSFELTLQGFDTGRRGASGVTWHPRLRVLLDMVFPPEFGLPREPVVRSLLGSEMASNLTVDTISAPLYRGHGGQLFEDWSAQITLTPSAYFA